MNLHILFGLDNRFERSNVETGKYPQCEIHFERKLIHFASKLCLYFGRSGNILDTFLFVNTCSDNSLASYNTDYLHSIYC